MEAPRGNSPRFLCHIACSAILLLALSSIAAAEDYPTRPVRLIVPFPAGGSNDVVGRLVASQLSQRLGQQVFVDNRGGAGGVIGTEAAATAAPDGYTILIVSIAHAVNSALYKLNYDPVKSFVPVTILATGPNVLAINPRLPVSSVNDLIRLAQQKPGELEYASAGIGTFQHLGGELFKLMAGVDILHVPYKGGGPAITDVISGHVNIVPGYEANNWWGIVAPAGTPLPIVEKLKNDVHAALQSPSLQEQFAREGASAVEMSSAEFGKYIVTEITKWGEVVEKSKIRPQ
jgi:tripartite-type tricarboxylate transporter receptor subunit TctC